jgi:hypothetical protein
MQLYVILPEKVSEFSGNAFRVGIEIENIMKHSHIMPDVSTAGTYSGGPHGEMLRFASWV